MSIKEYEVGKFHDKFHNVNSTADNTNIEEDRWTFDVSNEYPPTAYKVFAEFLDKSYLTDVEVICGERKLKCHRIILAGCSPYFKMMFMSGMEETRSDSITINDVDEKCLFDLIKFAYTGKVEIDIENVQNLLYTSDILQIESVAHACCRFMKHHLHPSNCIGVRAFAEQHNRVELMEYADQYARENFDKIVKCDDFERMTEMALVQMIQSDDTNVPCEEEIYHAIIKWVQYNSVERSQLLPKLLTCLRLQLLEINFFLENVAKEPILKENLECRDILDEVKIFHLRNKTSQIRGQRPRKSYSGVIFCVGGRGAAGDPFKSVEWYDVSRDQWLPIPDMSTRRRHVGVVAFKSKLYAIGGHDGADHLASGEVYDPRTNKWSPISPMSTMRRGIALASLGPDGPIYSVGGLDDNTCYAIVERYDPVANNWEQVAPMLVPRGGVAVAAHNGQLYAIGGNDGQASLESCERYDPHLNKWSYVAPMSIRRAGAGIAELDGLLYIVGGFDDNAPLDSVERYCSNKNQWTEIVSMSSPRGGVGVAALGGSFDKKGLSNYIKNINYLPSR